MSDITFKREYASQETIPFIDQWVQYCFGVSVKNKGYSESCQVSFFDKNGSRLYTMPFFLTPINTNGRATQFLINQMCKADQRVEMVLFSSAAKNQDGSNYVISHLETIHAKNHTVNFAHEINNHKLHLMDEDSGRIVVAELPLVFYGFFDEPEVNMSKLKWDRLNTKISKIIKAVESQDRDSINEVFKLITAIYDTCIKMVKDLPDQPKLVIAHSGNNTIN